MRLRDVKVGMKVTRFGQCAEVEEVDRSRQFSVKFKGETGHYSHLDLRLVQGSTAKPEAKAHKFQVGDLVDCDEDKIGNTSAVIGGMIVGGSGGERLVKGVLYCGHYANKEKEASWVPYQLIRPHVPAPKVEPVKAPVAEKVDALEAAKREACHALSISTDAGVRDGIGRAIIRGVEIGFRAGQKAAQGPYAIAVLEAKRGQVSRNLEHHRRMVDNGKGALECINGAIAILKGGE